MPAIVAMKEYVHVRLTAVSHKVKALGFWETLGAFSLNYVQVGIALVFEITEGPFQSP
jgi:hypothetical protein